MHQILHFYFLDCLPEVYTRGLFSLDIVDEGFYGFLIFYGVIWVPSDEDRVFDLGDVALEAYFICGVGVLIPVSGSALAGSGPSLLLHLGLFLIMIFLTFL